MLEFARAMAAEIYLKNLIYPAAMILARRRKLHFPQHT